MHGKNVNTGMMFVASPVWTYVGPVTWRYEPFCSLFLLLTVEEVLMSNPVSECLQRHVYQWALDHRVHHKYSETNADPHDARRGFLFSHIGWLVLTPHPDVEEKRKAVDMSDMEADPIVMWQKRYDNCLYDHKYQLFTSAAQLAQG